jgi:hypothetical protein
MLAEGGELIEQCIRTEPERFAAVFGKRPRARILIEVFGRPNSAKYGAIAVESAIAGAHLTRVRRTPKLLAIASRCS